MKGSRARITEAAFRLFLERGYDGTSMADIVAASGMSKGAVYFHFRDKEALHQAAVETFFLRFLDMDAPEGSEAEDLGYLVRRLCVGYKKMAQEVSQITPDRSAYYRFLMSILPAVRPAVRERIASARAELVAALRREQASGRISTPLEPGVVADQIISLIEGTGMLCVLEDRSDAAGALDKSLDAFVRMLRAGPGAP